MWRGQGQERRGERGALREGKGVMDPKTGCADRTGRAGEDLGSTQNRTGNRNLLAGAAPPAARRHVKLGSAPYKSTHRAVGADYFSPKLKTHLQQKGNVQSDTCKH